MPQPGTPGGYVMAALLVLVAVVSVLAIAQVTRPAHLVRTRPRSRWTPHLRVPRMPPPPCPRPPHGHGWWCPDPLRCPDATGAPRPTYDTHPAPAGDLTAPLDPLGTAWHLEGIRQRLESLEDRVATLEARTSRTLAEARDSTPWTPATPYASGDRVTLPDGTTGTVGTGSDPRGPRHTPGTPHAPWCQYPDLEHPAHGCGRDPEQHPGTQERPEHPGG